MTDLISRQSAIDAMAELQGRASTKAELKGISKAWKMIKQLPPIQHEIIYCGDGCKFWNRLAGEQAGTCDILRQCTSASFYCGNAKRSEVTE